MREGWREVTLTEVSDRLVGPAFTSKDFTTSEDDVRLVRGSNVAPGVLSWTNTRRWPRAKLANFERYLLEAGDVLIAMDGSITNAGLKSAIVREADLPALLVQRVTCVRAHAPVMQSFLAVVLTSGYFRAHVESIGTQSVIPHISGGDIGRFRFLLPPLPEQRRIVDLIGALDGTIVSVTEAKTAAERALDQAANHAVISAEGTAAQLGEVLTVVRGGSPRPIDKFYTASDGGLPWIRIGDVSPDGKYITSTEKKIRREGLSKTRAVKPGDFLLSNSMSFGRPYITRVDGCIHDGWLRLSDFKESFTEDYLYYLLRSMAVQAQFRKLAAGSSVQNLNKDKVASVRVNVPSLDHQRETTARLDAFMTVVELLAAEAENLHALRNNLLTALLSGEHEIPEKYDELIEEVAA